MLVGSYQSDEEGSPDYGCTGYTLVQNALHYLRVLSFRPWRPPPMADRTTQVPGTQRLDPAFSCLLPNHSHAP